MGVESATFINDFDAAQPSSTDLRSQGDDHLRLIKTVLKNTFGGATRQFQIPTTLSKSTNYSVVKADGESTIYVSTAGGVCTMTLPTLVAGDVGWKVHFIKTNSGANPMFIAPPAGTLNSGGVAGVAQARRSIPGVRITAIWDGTGWFVTRALALPIGSTVEFHGSALPAGFEWPNGQTLSSAANYPEYNSVMGALTTLDKRGRVGITLDNLGGSAAGRLAGGIITGTAVGNTGGSDTRTLLTGNLPPFTPAGSVSSNSVVSGGTQGGSSIGVYTNSGPQTLPAVGTAIVVTTTSSFTGTPQGGTSTAFGILQPSIMVSEILVVE